MRFIASIILIGVSAAVFFMFSNRFYDDIGELRAKAASFDTALSNSKALEKERDKLAVKYNSISKDDLAKIQKLLPENIDNIRLILEIEQIALPYGMELKNIKYSATDIDKVPASKGRGTTAPDAGGTTPISNKDYGVWDLSFSTTGTYNNFLNFMMDLEKNLRIVDISSIQFSSDAGSGSGSTLNPSSLSYTYDFKIKTYWLKN